MAELYRYTRCCRPDVLDVDRHAFTFHGSEVAVLRGRSDGGTTVVGLTRTVRNAGALVTEKAVIPPRSLVVGMPGKVIRTLTDDEVAVIVASAREYVAKAQRHRLAAGTTPTRP